PLTFPVAGRHTVEVIGRGPRGPEVVSLFFEQVGAAGKKDARSHTDEPRTLDAARVAIVERVNALRKGNALSALGRDDALDAIAQAYSDRMSRENFFAHVAPDGTDLRSRLTDAGYLYHASGENLGMAGGPLGAHFGIELSPGHRKNLLDPAFEKIGVGVTWKQVSDRTQAIVTEVMASPEDTHADPLTEAYDAIAAKRGELKLSKLSRSRT